MLVPRDTLSAGPFSLETQPRILPFASLVADNSWDAWRVLHRFPVWGPELSGDILPLEARLERDAISFSKGCYPGQEPIVMARHRGHPPTLLVRVRAKGATAGAALLFEGRKVGRITTVGRWPEHDEPNAMAFVKYTLVAEPTALEVEGGGEARVVEGEGP
jgi:hypothetical protein